jgi:hypothetical protein
VKERKTGEWKRSRERRSLLHSTVYSLLNQRQGSAVGGSKALSDIWCPERADSDRMLIIFFFFPSFRLLRLSVITPPKFYITTDTNGHEEGERYVPQTLACIGSWPPQLFCQPSSFLLIPEAIVYTYTFQPAPKDKIRSNQRLSQGTSESLTH